MPLCDICKQPALWRGYKDDQPLELYRCSADKPAPWKSGSPQRQGIYYRPISEQDLVVGATYSGEELDALFGLPAGSFNEDTRMIFVDQDGKTHAE